MTSLFRLHFPTPISFCTLAKTPNPNFKLNNTLPLFPSLISSLSHRKFISLPHRNLSRSIIRFSAGEFSGTVDDELSEEELDHEVDYSDDDDDIDVMALEHEAKEAVLEYSSSLSSILSIDDEKIDVKETSRTSKRSKPKKKIIPDNLLPRVAIVGRPNVGKSALFNRLVGGNRAIVVDEPGVTRDRLYGRSFWGQHEFMVVDTGGVLTISKSQTTVMEDLDITTTIGMDGIPLATREAAIARMPSMIEKQAIAAVEESPVVIFLVDGQAGLTAADVEIANWLRKHYSDKRVILAVNKCESPQKRIMQASEFWSLGFEPIPISAISGTGTGELLDLVCSEILKVEEPENLVEEDYVPAISIVGRPNVGKSSILNALVGEDRTIVSPISGTTRDAIDTEFIGADGQKFHLIDTAGIRKRTAVASAGSTTEALSVNRAFRAIRRSDVVALVVEALACITEQDFKIAERIEKEGKGCVIVVNKWDTIPNKNQQTALFYEQDVREKLRILDWAPVVYSTALAGHNVDKIIVAASEVEKERSRRLGTSILNQVVREAVAFKSPPRTRGGKRGRVYYCTQLYRMVVKSEDGRELRAFNFKQEDQSQEVRAVERRVLLETLAAQLPLDTIQYSSRLAKIEASSNGDTYLELVNGTKLLAKIVIGCDGIRSPIAKWMGFPEPKYAGHCAFRGLASYPDGQPFEPRVNYIYGKGLRAGYVPVSPTKVYWFICFNSSSPGTKTTDTSMLKKQAKELVKNWPLELLNIIDSTPDETVSKTPLVDRWLWPAITPPVSSGRVVLVGDAWHPMTPNLGQGACCALEDSVVLAKKLAGVINSDNDQSVEEAFRSYGSERWSRVFPLTVRANLVGSALQWDNPLVCSVRNNIVIPKLIRLGPLLEHTNFTFESLSS